MVDMPKIGLMPTVGQSTLGGLGGAATTGAGSFGDILQNMVSQAVTAQKTSEALTVGAASGDNVALHEVIQAVSKAELTLQTLVTVRDKAVEAYQQIIQMPV